MKRMFVPILMPSIAVLELALRAEPRPTTKLGIASDGRLAYDRWYDDLLHDVIPLIEQRFRVSRSADKRAIAGSSQGGADALGVGLAHPELFHWIGGFAPGFGVAAQQISRQTWMQRWSTEE